MYKILKAEKLAEKIFLMDVEAPRVARSCQPGEFVIVKMDEKGERIPLTICDFDREKGTVTIVFQIVGASTLKMSELQAGDAFQDFVGPLGQPSEFVKIGLILILANFLSRNREKINEPKTLGMTALICALPVGMVYLQPNLSTTIVICFMILCMVYVAGISYKWIAGAVAVGVPGFAALIYLSLQGFIPFLQKYQAQRIMGKIFHSSSEFTDLNRQQDNSMMAIGSGQLRGKGLFNNTLSSVKNGNFLSEEQTDFIFAVIGEELGFVGGVAVIALYALLVYECLWIAARAKDTAGRLIASGMAALLAFQSFANIAVATGIFPNTGLPLPFISSGLSSLLSMFIGMGVVLNVGLQRNNVTVQ